MKERPILFNSAMVRAINEDRKTKTRRIVKPQPYRLLVDDFLTSEKTTTKVGEHFETYGLPACPYGQPGDHLWLREEHYRIGHWEPVSGVKTKGGRQKWKFVADSDAIQYSDAPSVMYRSSRDTKHPEVSCWHKRLARFMPRKLSRITLEIVSVRLERLQDITEADAKAEGAAPYPFMDRMYNPNTRKMDIDPNFHRPRFKTLWQSINGDESWDANPFVWVIDFKSIKP